MERTAQLIQQEYSQVCATLGQLTVTKQILPLQIDELLKKALELDQEYKVATSKTMDATPAS